MQIKFWNYGKKHTQFTENFEFEVIINYLI